MARLPTPGSDSGKWGEILNDYLSQSHDSTGKIKVGAVTKSDVGLGNVDDTSDANKPISVATQGALDTKLSAAALDAQVAGKVQDGASATAAALSDAYGVPTEIAEKRGGGWWDRVSAPPSDTPSITAATSSQISGGLALIAPTTDYDYDPYFRYDGCRSVVTATGGVQANYPEMVVPETITDAQDIEAVFTAGRTGTQVIGVRAIVDGKLSHQQLVRLDATSGTDYYYRFHFSAAKVKHVKLIVEGATTFKGIITGARTVLQRPDGPCQNRHTAIGDSLQQGGPNLHPGAEQSGDYFYMRYESHSYFQSVLMGCDSYINLGAGGTGWGDNVPDNPFSARIPSALAGHPHVLGFYGSRNDQGEETQVLSAVINALAYVKEVPVVLVCGPQQAGYSALNELVRQGVVAAGRKWLDLDGVAASPDSNPTGHPTFAEQVTLARAAHEQIDMTHVLAVVEAANAARLATVTALAVSPPSPAATGATITLTAVISGSITAGNVQFYDNGTAIGSPIAVSSGTAVKTTSTLALGAHTLTARFLPVDLATVKGSISAGVAYTVTTNLGVTDTFNRTDGVVGNSENGKPWDTTTYTGWVIASNMLGNPSAPSGSYCTIDPGTPWGTYAWTMGGTYFADTRLVVFWGTANNMIYLNNGGGSNNWTLVRRVSSTSTTLGTAVSGASWTAGDVLTLVVAPGATSGHADLTFKKNGATLITVADADLSTLANNTKTGIGIGSSSGTAARLDTFVMTPAT